MLWLAKNILSRPLEYRWGAKTNIFKGAYGLSFCHKLIFNRKIKF